MKAKKLKTKIDKLCYYSNTLTKTLNIKDLNEIQYNILFIVIHCINLLKNKYNYIQLSFSKLKDILNKQNISYEELRNIFFNTFKKLEGYKATIKNEEQQKELSLKLIPTIEYDKKNNIVTFKINDSYINLFKDLHSNLSILNLTELIKIQGINNKKIYEYLNRFNNKQQIEYKNIIVIRINKYQFYKLFNIPDTYKIYNLKTQILDKAIKELNKTTIFKTLKYETLKTKKKIDSFKFTWEYTPLINLKNELESINIMKEIDREEKNKEFYNGYFNYEIKKQHKIIEQKRAITNHLNNKILLNNELNETEKNLIVENNEKTFFNETDKNKDRIDQLNSAKELKNSIEENKQNETKKDLKEKK